MNKPVWLAMILLVAGVASCKKSELDGKYAHCDRCTYTFTDKGPLIFEYKQFFGPQADDGTAPFSGLVIEVPKGVDAFNYGNKEIASDKVNYLMMCIYCMMVPLKTVGGTIKGTKVSSRKWLLDAVVYLESENTNLRDTMAFKEVFVK